MSQTEHLTVDQPTKMASDIGGEASGATLLSTLSVIWQHRRTVAAITLAGTFCVLVAVSRLEPLYSSEAALELNFNRQEAPKIVVNRQIASMDPAALVNGAVQSISSRANIGRAIKRLGLDAEPNANPSWLQKFLGGGRFMLGMARTHARVHEQRIEGLMRNLKVSGKPHLYVLTVTYTDPNPETAARIANALVIEHLRSDQVKNLSDKRSVLLSEVASLSDRLGAAHPRRLQAQAGLDRIDQAIKTVEEADADGDVVARSGQFLTLAEPNRTPISQKRVAILGMGFTFALAFSAAVVILIDNLMPRLQAKSQPPKRLQPQPQPQPSLRRIVQLEGAG